MHVIKKDRVNIIKANDDYFVLMPVYDEGRDGNSYVASYIRNPVIAWEVFTHQDADGAPVGPLSVSPICVDSEYHHLEKREPMNILYPDGSVMALDGSSCQNIDEFYSLKLPR